MPEKIPTPHEYDPSSPASTTTPTAPPLHPANATPGIARGAALTLELILHGRGAITDTDTDAPPSTGDLLGGLLGPYAIMAILFGILNIGAHLEVERPGRLALGGRGRWWRCLGWFLMGWTWPVVWLYVVWVVVRRWWAGAGTERSERERAERSESERAEGERGVGVSSRGDGLVVRRGLDLEKVDGMGDVEQGPGEGERGGLWAGVKRGLLFWRREGKRDGGEESNQGQVLEVPMPSKDVDSDGSSVEKAG